MDGKYIKRKVLEIARAVLILSVVFSLVFYSLQPIKEAKGATFNFTQTSWSSKTSNTASHDTTTGPPTDWNQYSDNDSTINTSNGTELKLNTASFTKTLTNDADFSGGTPYQTQVVEQGASSTVQLTSQATFTTSTTTAFYGRQLSMALGTDQYPRIFYNANSSALVYAKCNNIDCSSTLSSNVFPPNSVNYAVNSAFHQAVALDSDNLARVIGGDSAVHSWDGNNSALRFIRCTNADCSQKTTSINVESTPESAIYAPGPKSIAVYPLDKNITGVVYRYSDSAGIKLKYVTVNCTQTNCTPQAPTLIDSATGSGTYATIAFTPDGKPRIVYTTNEDGGSVKYVKCNDLACTDKITNTIAQAYTGNYSYDSSVVALNLGIDNNARIAFLSPARKLQFAKCDNPECSGVVPTQVSSFVFGTNEAYLVMALDSNNKATFIHDYTGGVARLTSCSDQACSSSNGTTISTGSNYKRYAIEIGSDNYPRASFSGDSFGSKFLYPNFYPTGTFTSGAVDIGSKVTSWENFSWTNTGASGSNITMRVRTSATPSFSGDFCSLPSNPTNLSSLNCAGVSTQHRYLQYEATLTASASPVETPKLDSVSIGYTSYPVSATLTSSVYNTNQDKNIISKISWNGSYPTSDETIKFQMRSSADGTTWTKWCGYTVCDDFDVFDASNNGVNIANGHTLKDGVDDQYFQYKAILFSSGIYTPILNDVTITYVVNAPPEIKDNTITASQITDQTNANWGKFKIDYSVKDVDTNEGTTNPGKVSPSFFYNLTDNCALTDNNCWQAIANSTLTFSPACEITESQILCPVAATTYTDYTVLWNVASQLSGDLKAFSTNARIRVVLNDNEAANNIARSASSPTTLDTKPPVASVFKIDSTLKQINLTATDNSILEYRISNKSDLSTDGSNVLSNDWQKPNANSITILPTAWTLTGPTDYESVYAGIRDMYNNLLMTTYTAPYAPRNIDIKDVSNVEANNYRLFIIWDKYDATTTAPFAKYEVYRSLDGTDFSSPPITTITNIDLNYYPDTTVIANIRYYYKVRMVDAEGDISDYSTTLSDLPDGVSEGEGGGAGKPLSIAIAPFAKEIKAFSAKIAWSTSDRSNSVVYYSTDKSFTKSANNTALVSDHEILLTGLSSNTTYYFKVESADVDGKKVSADNAGAGYSFTTVSGPTISSTAVESVTNKTATIAWNTNMDTNSYVVYSRSTGNLQGNYSVSEVGDANMVGGPPYQHRIKITGLDEETTYYFYVKSTDSESNIVVDNNRGAFYSLKTTNDTKAPVISEITPITVLSKAAVISWTTDEPSDGQIEFGSTSGHYLSTTPINTNMNIDHVGVLSELSPKATYFYRVKSADSAGNATSSDEQKLETSAAGEALIVVTKEVNKTIRETIPPIISNIRVISADAFKTTIAFDTNEPSIGFILYGKTTEYKNAEASTGFATKQEIVLPGLTPGATYHFQVKAQDQYGNAARSEDKTFTTKFISEALQEQEIQLENISQLQDYFDTLIESITPSLATPVISDVRIAETTESSAKITWKTNVRTSSMVALAEGKDYKKGSYSTEIGNTQDQVTQHSVNLINLRPGTSYHFMVKSFRIPQLVGVGPDMTFVTKATRIQAGVFDITNNSFRALWTTGEPTTSIVEYQNLTTKETFRKAEDARIINHAMKIDNLSPATTYKVRIFGYNQDNDIIETRDSILVTTSRDTVPPQITGLKIDSALIPGRTDRTQTVVSWRTDEPATTLVYYQEGNGTFKKDTASKVEITDSLTQNHIISITSLKVGTIYQIQVASTDQAGNYASIDPRTVVAPQQPESIMDIIFKNFSDTFQFVNKLR